MTLAWEHSRYGNTQTAKVGKVGCLTVTWDACRPKDETSPPPPYVVGILGHRMERRFSGDVEAKAFAERVVEKWLAEALALVSPDNPAET